MHASALPAATARRSPLLAFAAASLTLHAALLLGWRPAASVFSLAGGATPSLAVVLQSAAAPRHTTSTTHTAATTTPAARTPVRPPVPHMTAQQTKQVAADTPPPPPAAPTTTSVADGTEGTAMQQRLLGRVRGELLRYFRYPPLALRNGWQGTVLLGFRVNGQGDIEAIHVAHSSGYSALDDAAIGALRKVGRLTLDAEPATHSFDLQLPVIYRLEES